jgi:CRISPR-associated protein Cas5h
VVRVIAFDLKAKMAHFRLPDTTVTHASYPFIPRTALHGLIASILGLDGLDSSPPDGSNMEEGNLVGIKLMSPVRSSFQKMSMLGKGWAGSGTDSFNKPVSIEVIAEPYYQVYYAGVHLLTLENMLRSKRAKYHTYLGSCYCLVFPRYVFAQEAKLISSLPDTITTDTVVPSFVIERLLPQPGCEYARAGGLHYQHLGDRQFAGTLNMVYEVNGKAMVIEPKRSLPKEPPVKFLELDGGEVVCLW